VRVKVEEAKANALLLFTNFEGMKFQNSQQLSQLKHDDSKTTQQANSK
jgi:hypothetical protein